MIVIIQLCVELYLNYILPDPNMRLPLFVFRRILINDINVNLDIDNCDIYQYLGSGRARV